MQPHDIYPSRQYAVFTAQTAQQFDTERNRQAGLPRAINLAENIHSKHRISVFAKFRDLDAEAVQNTFNYMFYKFKKGIYLKIHDGKLVSFLPFSNFCYLNEFIDRLRPPPGMASIVDMVPSANHPWQWCADNALIEDLDTTDDTVTVLHDFFSVLCQQRVLPDIEFFVNYLKSPLLKKNNTEPFNHIWDSETHPLVSHNYTKYCPIISFSSQATFADLLLPTPEDWCRAAFQHSSKQLTATNRQYPVITETAWNTKNPMAIFRGTSTGAGINPRTNQRLALFEKGLRYPTHLDVGFSHWNKQTRKYQNNNHLSTIHRNPGEPVVPEMDLQEQSAYKYILCVEGFTAPHELAYALSSGSAVLLVKTKWTMWYSSFLSPFIHFIPIEADLSNLISSIEWCRNNDEAVKKIAHKAGKLANEKLSRDSMLDFAQLTFTQLSRATGFYTHVEDLVKKHHTTIKELYMSTIQPQFAGEFSLETVNKLPRSIGKLDGISLMWSDPTIMSRLYKTQSTVTDQYSMQGVTMVGKQITSASQSLDVEEKIIAWNNGLMVGTLVVNRFMAYLPNFCYTFGKHDQTWFSEYIDGITFDKWIETTYRPAQLFSILLQLTCALQVAQNFGAFIHGDLYPWNIIIQQHPRPITLYYQLSASHIISHTSDVIAIMINYNKSRGVVFSPQDRCMTSVGNLYLPNNKSLDVLTLLYSVQDALRTTNRPELAELHKFCPDEPGMSVKYGYTHIINTKISNNSVINSLSKYCAIQAVPRGNYRSIMLGGHCQYTINLAYKPRAALVQTAGDIFKRTAFQSETRFLNDMARLIMRQRLQWFNRLVETDAVSVVKKRWSSFHKATWGGSTKTPLFKFPQVDFKTTSPCPNLVNIYSQIKLVSYGRRRVLGDWGCVLMWLYQAIALGILDETFLPTTTLIGHFGFDLLTNLASANDLFLANKSPPPFDRHLLDQTLISDDSETKTNFVPLIG